MEQAKPLSEWTKILVGGVAIGLAGTAFWGGVKTGLARLEEKTTESQLAYRYGLTDVDAHVRMAWFSDNQLESVKIAGIGTCSLRLYPDLGRYQLVDSPLGAEIIDMYWNPSQRPASLDTQQPQDGRNGKHPYRHPNEVSAAQLESAADACSYSCVSTAP